jgi:hypothetical protein
MKTLRSPIPHISACVLGVGNDIFNHPVSPVPCRIVKTASIQLIRYSRTAHAFEAKIENQSDSLNFLFGSVDKCHAVTHQNLRFASAQHSFESAIGTDCHAPKPVSRL